MLLNPIYIIRNAVTHPTAKRFQQNICCHNFLILWMKTTRWRLFPRISHLTEETPPLQGMMGRGK